MNDKNELYVGDILGAGQTHEAVEQDIVERMTPDEHTDEIKRIKAEEQRKCVEILCGLADNGEPTAPRLLRKLVRIMEESPIASLDVIISQEVEIQNKTDNLDERIVAKRAEKVAQAVNAAAVIQLIAEERAPSTIPSWITEGAVKDISDVRQMADGEQTAEYLAQLVNDAITPPSS
jgi:hypothetical protein